MNLTTTTPEETKIERGFILSTLIHGLIFLLPLMIILILLSVLFNFIFKVVSPLGELLNNGGGAPDWFRNLLSVGIVIFFVFIFGVVVKSIRGKNYFVEIEKKYLMKIPLYTLVHQTVHQFSGLEKFPFSQVVLIDPYKSGTLMTGFVTAHVNENLYTIFVPTAPNPMNGNIYHVPKESIQFLTVTPQDAMRTIMGMGTGSSCLLESVD
ncbi:MAG: DUF502 domain-containing protein [Cyclobacteriaceae bacterium]|nr:DUF502 domain-containing protein [Cyclobacteriaceae bacterium]